MKLPLSILLLLSIFLQLPIASQTLQIIDVKDNEFPLIKVSLEFNEKQNISNKELILIDGTDTIDFQLDSVLKPGNNKAICFLIDGSYINEPIFDELVSDIKDYSLELKEGDFLNVILMLDNQSSHKCFYPFSTEFSTDHKEFIEQLDFQLSKLILNKQNTELKCSLEGAVNFIQSKTNLPEQKLLMVFSKTQFNKDYSLKQVQDLASSNNISVQLGPFELQKDSLENRQKKIYGIIAHTVDSIFSDYTQLRNSTNKIYLVNFQTNQKAKLNHFEIKYKHETVKGSFSYPDYFSFLKRNSVAVIALGVLLLAIVLFVVKRVVVKKQNKVPIIKPVVSTTNKVETSNKHATKLKKQQANGAVTPSITVHEEGQLSDYLINKLVLKIGRHPENDIVINNLTISKHHATLRNEGGIFFIEDNKSTNGIFVNDIKVNKSIVQAGDSIRLGRTIISLAY